MNRQMQSRPLTNGLIKESISIKGFSELMQKLIRTFTNLKISTEQMDFLYNALKGYTYYELNKAVKSICENNESIKGGTNLVYLIKKGMNRYGNDQKPIGWICPKCNAVIPMTELKCDCEFIGEISEDQKKEAMKLLKRLNLESIADTLNTRVNCKKYDDDIPF